MNRPLLLLDVDGVISLFGFDPKRPPAGRFALLDGNVHYLSATAGELVGRLARGFTLVWCSGWEERADEHLPGALGVPAGLHHLRFGAPDPGCGRHWKLGAIERFAGDSGPLAWVDDGLDESCSVWAAARPGPTLLVRTAPEQGLRAEHVEELEAWAASLRSAGASARR
jgi:hypothetical protein